MARYIKVNPKVAQYLRLENDRNRAKDGNYLLWQADMLAFGRLTELPQILEQIGGIALAAHEARQEQDGIVVRELPTATDERFVIEAKQPEETEPGEVEQAETGAEPEPEQPVEGENTEAEPENTEEEPGGEMITIPEPTENDDKVETTNEETEA